MLGKIFLATVLALSGFLVWQNSAFLRLPAPCEEPIAYAIGSLDKRFGLSHENLLKALVSAEAVWERPSGRDLFVYSPEKATLPVNLVYDYRQETTSVLTNLGETLERTEATYDALRTKYLSLKADYEQAKSIYESRVRTFNANNDAYALEVEAWNSGPRTSKSQFEKLGKMKAALENEAQTLRTLEIELNRTVREVNILVERLNDTASHLNLDVDKYNTIGASRGETFTGGVYYSAQGEQGIDIFEFSNQDKLVRILAHELGHALGLEHNGDPEAIMYQLNRGEAKALSDADISSLEILCGTE